MQVDWSKIGYRTRWFIRYMFVRLSLLIMTYPNQMREVLLFVCSKMAEESNLSPKLPAAGRTREV